MTARVKFEFLIRADEIVVASVARACNDQSFELPSRLYVEMAAFFAGFIGVLNC